MPSDELPGWSTRVIPNRFPALAPAGDRQYVPAGRGMRLAGFGYHEVIIESARHDADLTTMTGAAVASVLRTFRARFIELSARPGVETVSVFRNHGDAAGASLAHPHSQLIATAVMAPLAEDRTGWARARFADTARCTVCDDLENELADATRVVEATTGFLVTVPFAATSPFELRITPCRHQPSFGWANDAELDELAFVLRRALQRLRLALDDPPYNLVIESGPLDGRDARSGHWWLRIVPGPVAAGGFELSTGFPINPSLPESDAATLRAIPVPDPDRLPPGSE